MKKLVSILIAVAVIINITSACDYAVEINSTPSEAESVIIGGMTCISSAENSTATGMFCEDGSLSVAWFCRKDGARYVYSTLVPSGLVSELPVTENGIVDLQYIIDNAEALELDVSVVTVIKDESDGSTETYDSDILKKNTVRKCLENACGDLKTYNSKMLLESSQYSPVVIRVLETKTVERYFVRTNPKFLKMGLTIAEVSAAIMAKLDVPRAAAWSYASAAISFVNGKLPSDITLEEYEGAVRYFRTSSYRGPNDSTFKMCPTVNEEYAVLYTILISYADADEDTTDYMDVTSVVGEPEESYLNSPNAFTTSAIISNAYEYYSRH